MRALILAAGRGSRLRPLTDVVPKPLVKVNGHRLIDWQIAALRRAGVSSFVINTAHLSQAFETFPALMAEKGFDVAISQEGRTAEDALESLGGIVHALPLLKKDGHENEPFLVLAGDVVHDFDLSRLIAKREEILNGKIDGHIVAVPNPKFHLKGDMTVREDATIEPGSGPHTYGCLMVVSPRIFTGLLAVRAKLFPWLWQFARSGRLTGEVHEGFWGNIGSEQELAWLASCEDACVLAQY